MPLAGLVWIFGQHYRTVIMYKGIIHAEIKRADCCGCIYDTHLYMYGVGKRGWEVNVQATFWEKFFTFSRNGKMLLWH